MTSPAAENSSTTGTVLWFKAQKGYGFVKPADGGADVFVHVAELAASGIRDLAEGQQIRFRRDTYGDGRFFAVGIELVG